MQLCYNITISNDDANYGTYYMEVQNNATGSAVGNDFAFDGFEIYKNLPDIIVERKDDCSADTLFVSTDFETLMHNMGWTENQEIDVSAVENDPDLRKYRFGLHGSDPEDPERTAYVGNTYFAFLEGLQEVRNEQGVVTEIKVGTDVTRYNNSDASKPDPATTVLTPGGGKYRWVRVNKHLTVDVPISRFSFRAVVSTQKSITGEHAYPRTQQEAEDAGKVLNFRALKDYNYAVQQWQSDPSAYKPDGLNGADPTVIDINEDGEIVEGSGRIASGALNETTIKDPANEEAYLKLIEELYMRLQIPRIRCPWLDGDELHLYALDVRNTDLKYDGEKVYSDAETYAEASGQYHVILFGAETVNAWEKPWDENGPGWAGEDGTHYGLDLTSTCNLMTGFVVQPSATIVIETDFEKHTAVCLGSLKKITAELNFYDRESGASTSKPNFLKYIFDWYLGTEEDYYALADQYEFTVKEALKEYRDDHNHTLAPITRENLQTWHDEEATSDTDRKKAEMLLSLIGNPETGEGVLLRTGTEPGKAFDLEIESTEIMAMPYVTNSEIAIRNYVYCSDETNVDLGVSDSSTPELHIGYVLSPFKGEVPLRLGHVNMSDEVSLTLPVSEGFDADGNIVGDRLGVEEGAVVSVRNDNSSEYPPVGEIVEFSITKNPAEATIIIKLNGSQAKTLLKEGQQYELLIPFEQYNETELLSNECSGLVSLPVKIVPEYLTWKGGTSDNWYDESKWNQSTKKDLYFEGWNGADADKDANGTDADLTKAFSPLYFTKITIPGGEELALSEPAKVTENGHSFLPSWAEDGSDSIRYEMAVADAQGNIAPYYINKVEQIYFKPEASIYRQDYLTYGKAWVDFEMEEGKPYWMSAPLQNVYAGDMYAPSDNGRQETAVFGDGITFAGKNEVAAGTAMTETNSRWSPAFYQKAWDKDISYITEEGYTHGTSTPVNVAAVKSNWSIEYNDVWVPYSEGKGFYARVEDLPEDNTTGYALVRLPKADTEYSYETKAANNLSKGENISRTNAYKLWGDTEEATKGNVTVDLSKVDGDNQHFLVGNPYMAYLDMDEFFGGNSSVLAKKYWLLENGTSKAVVGTPDVDWKGNETEDATDGGTIDGLIPPMTAFFVELANTSTTTQADNAGAETSIAITFTPDMMAKRPQSTAETKAASFAATNPTLTITAERGETRNVAKLLTSDKAENGYRASEDAVVLLDSELDAPMVYTVAGSRAAQVNAVKKISNIGLGVYNADDDEATLTISGISRMATPLYLYDAATRQSTRLEGDSYELRVSGDSHGRYFLRDAELGDELENTISIYSARPGEVIVSSLRLVKDIRVFALNGSQVRRFSVNTTRYTFTLPAGIYLIQATDGERGQTEKVLVR